MSAEQSKQSYTMSLQTWEKGQETNMRCGPHGVVTELMCATAHFSSLAYEFMILLLKNSGTCS